MKQIWPGVVLLIVALILVLVSCAPGQPPAPGDLQGGLGTIGRHIDREAGVVCYWLPGYQAISLSCLPIGETRLR
jgi:hypothetical protein